MCRAILYPRCKLFITSGGKEQAAGIVKEKVHENQSVKNAISDKNIVKEIYVKNKIYNIVVK